MSKHGFVTQMKNGQACNWKAKKNRKSFRFFLFLQI
jgi:hypothetical protein